MTSVFRGHQYHLRTQPGISRIHPGYSELRGNGENRNRKWSSSQADEKSWLVTFFLGLGTPDWMCVEPSCYCGDKINDDSVRFRSTV